MIYSLFFTFIVRIVVSLIVTFFQSTETTLLIGNISRSSVKPCYISYVSGFQSRCNVSGTSHKQRKIRDTSALRDASELLDYSKRMSVEEPRLAGISLSLLDSG